MFPEQKTANFHIFAYLNPDTGYRILGAKILRILTTALAAQQKFNRNLNLLNPPLPLMFQLCLEVDASGRQGASRPGGTRRNWQNFTTRYNLDILKDHLLRATRRKQPDYNINRDYFDKIGFYTHS